MVIFGSNLTKVEFQVKAEVPHGVTIRVSGSVPQLGYFSPSTSIPMHTSPEEYPVWKSDPILLPKNVVISYKYLRYSGGVFYDWELPRKSIHRITLTSRKTPVISDIYGLYDDSNAVNMGDNIKRSSTSEPLKNKGKSFGSCPALDSKHALTGQAQGEKRPIILVAYRLPVIITRQKGEEIEIKWDVENMYLFSERTLSDQYSVWWCGAITHLRTDDIFNQDMKYSTSDMMIIKKKLASMHCLPIFLDSGLNDLYYNGYCKSVLSPMLHGCSMVFDDANTDFSWQKNTSEILKFQKAYRRVNNLFAQEILNYCEHFGFLKLEPIIWINGYHLMLLPRDLRLYTANMNKKHGPASRPPSATPNIYTSSSITTNELCDLSSTSPFTPVSEDSYSHRVSGYSDDDSSDYGNLFSPGPTFVDNLEDDMDDEMMMKLYADGNSIPAEYDGETRDDEPEELRKEPSTPEVKAIKMKIIFFLHLPFPSYELFRQLPLRTSILRGILASDMIGTHTYSSARHIISSCCRHLGITQKIQQNGNIALQWGSRSVSFYISHVGLDQTLFEEMMSDPVSLSTELSITQLYPNKHIIAGVDELYQTNAIRYKILAFKQLLDEIPMYRKNTVLIQVCYQQRSTVFGESSQNLYEKQIIQAAKECNDAYPGSVDLRLLTGSFYPIGERIGLWKSSSIYLNTSLAQGLNLHPQEFLLARKEQGGVVIVSEFSNAHEFLNGALTVNPWNSSDIVSQLEKALEMSKSEVKMRQLRDLESIHRREKKKWSNQIVEEALNNDSEMIETMREPGADQLSNDDAYSIVTHLSHHQVLQSYQTSKSRFFMLDYGGTLLSKEGFFRDLKDDFRGVFHRRPNAAMTKVLQQLCDDPRNEVWVISSSSSMVMGEMLNGFSNLGLVAVSGLKKRRPGSTEWIASSEYRKKVLPLEEEILSLCREYVFQTNGSTLYHDHYVVRFHYQYCDPDLGKTMADKLVSELTELLRDVSVKIVHDVGVVEVRSFLGTRGSVVKGMLEEYKAEKGEDPEFVFCMGDTAVDEPMFGDIQNLYHSSMSEKQPIVITCTVGEKLTRAQFFTNSVQENINLFALLTT